LPTSTLRRLLSAESTCADDNTWLEAEPVSAAPVLTRPIFSATCEVPRATCWTLREICRVAASCSSTAAAIAVAIWEMLLAFSRARPGWRIAEACG
jgi:hypothetical protein